MGRLTGKVAIVTGAAAQAEGVGNGSAVATLFAREGASVVLVNRNLERAQALEAAIRAEGGEAAAFAADVTDPAATEAMAAFAVERYGRLDILHNNVGVGAGGNTVTQSLDDWNRIVATNLTSAMLTCRACIPRMREAGGGSIINVSSSAGMLGLSGTPGAVAYIGGEGRAAGPHPVGRRRPRGGGHPRQLPDRRHRLHAAGQAAWARRAASAAARPCRCRPRAPAGTSLTPRSTSPATSRAGSPA